MSRVLEMWSGMTGTVLPYALATAPAGWLLCNGAAVAPGTADVLRAALIAAGSPYGTSGANPLLPDLRGRVAAGKDNMGGTAAGRLSNAGTGNPGVDGAALGAAGGADRHTMTEAQMPAHVHSSGAGNNGFWVDVGGRYVANASGSVINLNNVPNTASAGSGAAHPNLQPTIVLNHIIKA